MTLIYSLLLQILNLCNELESSWKLRVILLINYGALVSQLGNLNDSVRIMKQAVRLCMEKLKFDIELEELIPICLLNLANCFIKGNNLKKAQKLCVESLYRIEPKVILLFNQIFAKIKASVPKNLAKDSFFKSQLSILLNGYLTFGKVIQLQRQTDIGTKDDETKFFENGRRLATKFLGSKSYFVQKFAFHMDSKMKILNNILDSSMDNKKSDISIRSHSKEYRIKNFDSSKLRNSMSASRGSEKEFDSSKKGREPYKQAKRK